MDEAKSQPLWVNCQESHIVTGSNQYFLISKKKEKIEEKKSFKRKKEWTNNLVNDKDKIEVEEDFFDLLELRLI